MSGSLGKLIESARGKLEGQALLDKFPLMAERHPYCGDADDLSMLLRKLPFPYSSLTSSACFDEDYPIPPKEAFRDDMRDLPVDEGEWAVLQRLCARKGISTFGQLHDCYLATDVLALCDVLVNFRTSFKAVLKLDPLGFLTLPKCAWYGALYRSKAKIQLVTADQEPVSYTHLTLPTKA